MHQSFSTIAILMALLSGCLTKSSDETLPIDQFRPVPWNNKIKYDTLFDARDGKAYRTVTIGTQTWMAENLNYSGSNNNIGRCTNDDERFCGKYGRMYSWSTAMNADTSYDKKFLGTQGIKQGICPENYSIPRVLDWDILFTFIENSEGVGQGNAGAAVQGVESWKSDTINREDRFGFRGIGGGVGDLLKNGQVESYQVGVYEWWWTSNEYNSEIANHIFISYGYKNYDVDTDNKTWLGHLRCIKTSTITIP